MARRDEHSDFSTVVLLLVIIAIIAGLSKPGPNNEPYTGVCNAPTTQGGC